MLADNPKCRAWLTTYRIIPNYRGDEVGARLLCAQKF